MFYVIWTARLTVAAYLTAIGLFLAGKARWLVQILWTAGVTIFGLHVLAAFHYLHHWSHAAARQHTAEQTKELFGWDWGGGIWFNYLFLVLWGVDVVLGWIRSGNSASKRFSKLSTGIHLYMAFIVLNATVVFGPAWWRPVMAGVGLCFLFLVFRRKRPGVERSKHS